MKASIAASTRLGQPLLRLAPLPIPWPPPLVSNRDYPDAIWKAFVVNNIGKPTEAIKSIVSVLVVEANQIISFNSVICRRQCFVKELLAQALPPLVVPPPCAVQLRFGLRLQYDPLHAFSLRSSSMASR